MSIVHQAVDSILCQRHKVFVGRQEGKDAELRKKTRQCDKRKEEREAGMKGYRLARMVDTGIQDRGYRDLAYHVYLQRATLPMAHYSLDSMQK